MHGTLLSIFSPSGSNSVVLWGVASEGLNSLEAFGKEHFS